MIVVAVQIGVGLQNSQALVEPFHEVRHQIDGGDQFIDDIIEGLTLGDLHAALTVQHLNSHHIAANPGAAHDDILLIEEMGLDGQFHFDPRAILSGR